MAIDFYYVRRKIDYCKCDKCGFIFLESGKIPSDNFEEDLKKDGWTEKNEKWFCKKCSEK